MAEKVQRSEGRREDRGGARRGKGRVGRAWCTAVYLAPEGGSAGIGQVVAKVPADGDLDGVGRPISRALDVGMHPQPRRQAPADARDSAVLVPAPEEWPRLRRQHAKPGSTVQVAVPPGPRPRSPPARTAPRRRRRRPARSAAGARPVPVLSLIRCYDETERTPRVRSPLDAPPCAGCWHRRAAGANAPAPRPRRSGTLPGQPRRPVVPTLAHPEQAPAPGVGRVRPRRRGNSPAARLRPGPPVADHSARARDAIPQGRRSHLPRPRTARPPAGAGPPLGGPPPRPPPLPLQRRILRHRRRSSAASKLRPACPAGRHPLPVLRRIAPPGARIRRLAERRLQRVTPDWFDFDQAKADVRHVTRR